jgi:DMSO reductase anchor subunit
MRPTWPLLVLTIGQGLAAGLMTAYAALNLGGAGATAVLWAALAAAAVGGAGSFFHMHRLAAAKYVLRRLASSWLSREALSTGIFGAALAGVLLWRLVALHPGGGFAAAAVAAALIGWGAVWITAQLYATIRAMMSWNTPLTVLTMAAAALVGGGVTALAVSPRAALAVRLVLAGIIAMSLVFKLMQWRHFRRQHENLGQQATGFPFGSVRLYDTGTSKAPYRVQTQTWEGISAVLLLAAGTSRVALLVAALAWLVGICLDRWLFFADALHSSRIFFPIDGARAASR